MSAPASTAVSVRRAPHTAGDGMPADRHEAYRRGLCRTCRVAPYSAGRTRCADCHARYAAGEEPEDLS